MANRRIETDQTVYTFKSSGNPHDFILGAKPNLVGDGEIYKFHIPDTESDVFGGFRKVMLEVETDESNMIVQFDALLDIFYVPPSFLVAKEKTPTKLGQVSFSGNLVKGSRKPKWNSKIIVDCPFNEANSSGLPAAVRSIGPGAFLTCVVQSLFGTKNGIKMLGLEGFQLPDADAGETEIKVNG